MDQTLIDRYDIPVPRYTSYPTAPHFHAGIGADSYGSWLGESPADAALSLYVHIPFCRSLCWYCGCHMQVVNRPEPLVAYLEAIHREIDLVVARLGEGRRVRHLHFGGGTPTVLEPDQIRELMARFRRHFSFEPGAEIAIEIDPRRLNPARIDALAECGFTRASLGVQDVAYEVQRAVNRVQSRQEVRRIADGLRRAGISALNVDLLYGLPHQTVRHVLDSIDSVMEFAPDRLALFGYAHVPHMKPHQKLIPEEALPGALERFAQAEAASARLVALGYQPIGLDHFARQDDSLGIAARAGRLRRNFQGYTVDPADMLVALGASSIGSLPQGYIQNEADIRSYMHRMAQGQLATVRGLSLTEDDRLRATLIEKLMCSMHVDLEEVCALFGRRPESLGLDFDRLAQLEIDGLVRVQGWTWTVPEEMRPFLRIPAALFDAYLGQGQARHARAV